jgi:hypothetical protein
MGQALPETLSPARSRSPEDLRVQPGAYGRSLTIQRQFPPTLTRNAYAPIH